MNTTINNYPTYINSRQICNRTAFTGTFKNTPELVKAIECASDHDLHKFSSLLGRMTKVDDNKSFQLGSSVKFLQRAEENRKDVFLLDNTDNTKTNLSHEEISIYAEGFTNKCYKNVIKKVIGILEDIYPDPNHANKDRAESIKMISELTEK